MKSQPENGQRSLLDTFREELKDCIREVLSTMNIGQPATETLPLTLTVPQFCKQMNISRTVAYDMINSAGFPAFRVGSKYLINSQGLQKWINKQCNWEE